MALDTGKKKIALELNKSPVTQVKSKSKLGIIADEMESSLQALEQNAIAIDQADWYNSFVETTEADFRKFAEENKGNPNNMTEVVNAYSESILAQVPIAYKQTAVSILAHKKANAINKASTDYINLKNDKAAAGNVKNFDYTSGEINEGFENIFNNATDSWETKINKINQEAVNNSIPLLNNNSHASQNLVDGFVINQSAHNKLFYQGINDFTENRLLAIMQSFDSEDQAFNYLQSWLNGEDVYPMPESNNAVMTEYKKYISEQGTRDKIYESVFGKFNNIRGKRIADLNASKNNFSFEAAIEPGGAFHFMNFMEGKNRNFSLHMSKHASSVKNTDKNKLMKHFAKVTKLADKADEARRFKFVTGLSKEEKYEMLDMLLYSEGIHDGREILKVTDANYSKMKAIYKAQGLVPKHWAAFIKSETGKLDDEGVMKNFKEKLDLYNDIKNDFVVGSLEADPFLVHVANSDYTTDMDLITAGTKWGTRDMKKITEYVDTIALENMDKLKFEINEALDGNPNIIDDIFLPWRESVSRDKSWSTFLGDNKYSDLLFPGWTFWARSPAELFEDNPQLLEEFTAKVLENIKINAPNATFNMFPKDNGIITNAVYKSLDQMLAGGWAPSKYTKAGDNKYHLIKNGIEREYGIDGTVLNADGIAHVEAWYDSLPKDQKVGLLGIKENGDEWTLKEITNVIMDEDKNIIYQPTNQLVKNKMSYRISIINPDGKVIRVTPSDAVWVPDAFDQEINPDAPANVGQLVEWLAQDRKNFIDKWLGPAKPDDNGLETVIKKASHGVEKLKIRMADWSWMVDFPFANDIPNEWKPFKMLFNIGQNVPDLSEAKKNIELQSIKENEVLSYSQKINKNNKIPTNSKFVEGLFAPHKMPVRNYNESTMFMQFINDNWQDKSLPLTFRTNNYMAVKKIKGGWNGALDLKNEGNEAAVFAHPADSIRAGVITMINMSTIVNNKLVKKYGDTPSLEEILSAYAEDSDVYIKSAIEQGFDVTEPVNFQDQDQMHNIIKFMIRHEMGNEAFDKYYPEGNLILDVYIQQGYKNGINHFAGKLLKY